MPTSPFASLPPRDDESGHWNVVIETPMGSGNKFKFEKTLGVFALATALPAGSVFPYDFGFIPATRGADGDPIDVLVLIDAPAFPGCLVHARLIGVIEANQTERDGTTQRNDRLIAVAAKSRVHDGVRSLRDLSRNLLHEIEHFFASYNTAHGKTFKPKARCGPAQAERLVRRAMRAHAREAGTPR